jgi:hypothetical protein
VRNRTEKKTDSNSSKKKRITPEVKCETIDGEGNVGQGIRAGGGDAGTYKLSENSSFYSNSQFQSFLYDQVAAYTNMLLKKKQKSLVSGAPLSGAHRSSEGRPGYDYFKQKSNIE